ncbi:sperm acrosome-associated protein 7-like isoform X2 [Oryctolagus cuniculus]|uniref:sperm acrosome-associated protein 7-like isoform X2 n=1 Tax=Oryctolagus cuniculus TaxID=9986 RepID=UPI00387902F3
MAASRGAGTVFILLLYCWREAKLWPIRMPPDLRAEMSPTFKNLDDDVATVFDEILVQEILDPNKTSVLEMQKPPATSFPKTLLREDSPLSIPGKQHEKLSSGNTNRLSFDEEEKETLYQIKSLAALEKIIGSLRRAIGNSLQKRKRLHESVLSALYYKSRLGPQ